MTDEDRKTEIENSPGQISQKRRTLIKSAAVAAPVVFTLRSGTAAALESIDTCVARDQEIAQDPNQAPRPRLQGTTGDTWVRTQTSCRRLRNPNVSDPNKGFFYVYKDPTGSDPDAWFRLNNPNKVYRDHPTNPNKMVLATNPNKEFDIVVTTHDCMVLILFDDQGNVLSYGRYMTNDGTPIPTNQGLPLTNSCWASISPLTAGP